MKVETFPEAEHGAALAARVADDLRAAIATGTRASIAVPGGSTPAPFLEALSRKDLDWEKVVVTLSDERCVPADHMRSNAAMVRQHLFQGAAQAAQFVPLYAKGQEIEAVENTLIVKALPLYVSVLGMGDDMHTASLFPGTPGLAQLLDPKGDGQVRFVEPPGAGEARVTLTANALASAAKTYLFIKGKAKRAALDRAMATDDPVDAPIRAILDAATAPVAFYAG